MATKTKVIIFGGIGTAINIAEGIFDASVNYNAKVEMLGFAFDAPEYGKEINGFPVLCGTKEAYKKYEKFSDVKFIFQMNHHYKMEERAALVKSYQIPGDRWYTFIHPTAFISRSVKIGFGTVVYTHCAIHSNAVIGNHCTFSALTTIGHDTVLNNHVYTGPHVCVGSNVVIGKCSFIGLNTSVANNISIAPNSLIGHGSTVTKNISDSGKIYIGSPAKLLKNIIS